GPTLEMCAAGLMHDPRGQKDPPIFLPESIDLSGQGRGFQRRIAGKRRRNCTARAQFAENADRRRAVTCRAASAAAPGSARYKADLPTTLGGRLAFGEVPEWSNGTVSKTVVRVTVPWVRIPPSPPIPTYCQQLTSDRPLPPRPTACS